MCRKLKEGTKWTNEEKIQLYHQPLEVHLIKLGPLTEEFLTRKKVGWSKVDFGMNFEVTNDGYYKWTSGGGLNGIHMHRIQTLLDALKSIGYETERNRETESDTPVTKYIYKLEKKF